MKLSAKLLATIVIETLLVIIIISILTYNYTQADSQLIFLLAAVLSLMALVMIWLALRFIIRPIKLLTQTAQAIKAGQTFHHAPLFFKDEIGDLAKSFNEMLEHLNQTTISKNWFEVMVSSMGDAIIATDAVGIITFVNRMAEQLTGWSQTDVVGKKNVAAVFNIIHAQTRRPLPNPISYVIHDGAVIGSVNHTLLLRQDGTECPIDNRATPIRNEQGEVIGAVLVFRDISDKYQREQKLLNSERRFRIISDSTADAIVSMDTQNRIIFWNQAGIKIFGYTREEILGQELTRLFPENFPETDLSGLAHFLKTHETTIIGKTIELTGIRKTGEEFPLELSLSMWEREKGTGADRLFTGILRDISLRKQADEEKKNLEVQLLHAHKLEAIGQLAAGIAHEINTPIQYVGDNTRFLQKSFQGILTFIAKTQELIADLEPKLSDQPLLEELKAIHKKMNMDYLSQEIPKAIGQSLEGVGRVSEIIKAMKEFSHPGTKNKTPVNLNHALETTIAVSKNEWKYVATIEMEFDPNLPLVACLPNEMNQVFLNLIVNAAHSIAEKTGPESNTLGTIKIQTLQAGDTVEIRIGDTGNGIPSSIQNRIFEPFFTTKDVGKGTGQGLAIAHSVVVDKHQGKLTFVTEPGAGTTFIISIPIG